MSDSTFKPGGKYELNNKEKEIHVSDEVRFIVCYTNETAVKLYEY